MKMKNPDKTYFGKTIYDESHDRRQTVSNLRAPVRISWGLKIAILFSAFVGLIITMVVISMNQKDIHLVTENYYEKEIAYQDQIDSERNTASLVSIPVVTYYKDNNKITIIYPEQFKVGPATGSIHFFRPSDANQDFILPINFNPDLEQSIPIGSLQKGLWKIKMEWTAGQQKYYMEERLVLL